MNKVIRVLLTMTILSGIALSSSLAIAEDNEVIDTVELTVPVACTMGGVGTTSHNASINPGTYSGASGSDYEAGIGKTTLTTFCNDNNGFSVYAIGFTNDLYEGETHTKLIGQNTNLAISTKVYTNGDTDSNWSMKVTKVDNPASGDPITYNPDNMSIQNSFNSWHTVPDVYTKVAQYNSNTTDPATTDTTLGAKLETTYATYISSAQAADTYTGQVKYTMVHPYNARTPEPPFFEVLYTGRPLSDTPGQENPVKIRMADLPEDGNVEYNLLGTTIGSYDKLTSGKLYAGYFKYTGTLDDFDEYLEDYEVYDGSNYDWSTQAYQTVDAARIEPEDKTIYMVKEVPSNLYLKNHTYVLSYKSSMVTSDIRVFSNIDDVWYSGVGFYVEGDNLSGRFATGYRYRSQNPDGTEHIDFISSQESFGVPGFISHVSIASRIKVGDIDVLPYWNTLDGYNVTGAYTMIITMPTLLEPDIEFSYPQHSPIITKIDAGE